MIFKNKSDAMHYVEDNITREEISHRGGGVQISLDGIGIDGGLMSAYQNYLGGGLLGAIQSDNNIKTPHGINSIDSDLDLLEQCIKEYFFIVQGGDYELYEGGDVIDFEEQQKMPPSAY
jgi:hypothetical protein